MPELVIHVCCCSLEHREMTGAYGPRSFVQIRGIKTILTVNYGFSEQIRMSVDLEVDPTHGGVPGKNYGNTLFAQIAPQRLIHSPKPAAQRVSSIIRAAAQEGESPPVQSTARALREMALVYWNYQRICDAWISHLHHPRDVGPETPYARPVQLEDVKAVVGFNQRQERSQLKSATDSNHLRHYEWHTIAT
jgi:hypothetical protein